MSTSDRTNILSTVYHGNIDQIYGGMDIRM